MRQHKIEGLKRGIATGESARRNGIPIYNSATFVLACMPLVNPRRPVRTVADFKAVDRLNRGNIEIPSKRLESLLKRRSDFEARQDCRVMENLNRCKTAVSFDYDIFAFTVV